jgi:hypothetical protein
MVPCARDRSSPTEVLAWQHLRPPGLLAMLGPKRPGERARQGMLVIDNALMNHGG